MIVTSYILLFITTFIFCMIYYYIFVMGTVSFYEFAYLLSHNMGAGGSLPVVLDTIIPCLLPFILISTIFVLLNKFVLKTNKKKLIFSIIMLVVSLLCLVRTVHLDDYIINKSKKTDIYEKYYVNTNDVKINIPDKKRNLIIIYLESMEITYSDKKNGGIFDYNLIPN